MPSAPTATYREGLTIGQLARQWERDASFVRSLIDSGKLVTDERGCITVQSLREFYRSNPHSLDGLPTLACGSPSRGRGRRSGHPSSATPAPPQDEGTMWTLRASTAAPLA